MNGSVWPWLTFSLTEHSSAVVSAFEEKKCILSRTFKHPWSCICKYLWNFVWWDKCSQPQFFPGSFTPRFYEDLPSNPYLTLYPREFFCKIPLWSPFSSKNGPMSCNKRLALLIHSDTYYFTVRMFFFC
jgi:hypothetical protein